MGLPSSTNPQQENQSAVWKAWATMASARTGSVRSSRASAEQYRPLKRRMPAEKSSISINEEKNALKSSGITSAWSASRKWKASRKRPKTAPQNIALRNTTSESRSRAVASMVRSVAQAIWARRRKNSRASASTESGRTVSAVAPWILAVLIGRPGIRPASPRRRSPAP